MSESTLKSNRPDRSRHGLYIEVDTAEEIAALAERSKLSFNEATIQLVQLGLEVVKNRK